MRHKDYSFMSRAFLVLALCLLVLLWTGCGSGSTVATLGGDKLAGDKIVMKKPEKPPKPPPKDNTPPTAVTDLASDGVTYCSIYLTWTATGDDGSEGQAAIYDVRYSTSPINGENWESATQAYGEPSPQPSGSTETYKLCYLSPETTYYVALKVADEAGNYSDLSNVISATTSEAPPGAWIIELVDGSCILGSHDLDLAYDPTDGNPSVAYPDWLANTHKFAHWNGTFWEKQLIGDDGYNDVHLAYGPDGNPTLSLAGSEGLKFARWDGSFWQVEDIGEAYRHSLAYNPLTGKPSISKGGSSGKGKNKTATVDLLSWDGSSWGNEIIAMATSPDYYSLAFDIDGNPSVAYRDRVEDASVYFLKFAHWNGSSWDIETVLEVPGGMVYQLSSAYNSQTGYPSISFTQGGIGLVSILKFASWNGSSWDIEVVDNDGYTGGGNSLAYDSSGTPFISYYRSDLDTVRTVRLAGWNGTSWDIEIVDSDPPNGMAFTRETVLRFDPDGDPSIAYSAHKAHMYGLPEPLLLARKQVSQ